MYVHVHVYMYMYQMFKDIWMLVLIIHPTTVTC